MTESYNSQIRCAHPFSPTRSLRSAELSQTTQVSTYRFARNYTFPPASPTLAPPQSRMIHMTIRHATLLSLLLFASPVFAELKLEKGDHVCLVGNELGERMQHQNQFESLLHQQFPNLELVVRNLCFPGDEPFTRIRSKNFGEPDKHLTHSQANVILYFFGFNESFDGDKGLDAFKADMTRLVNETKAKDYGKGAPKLVLVSPIAFENTGDKNLSDGAANNARLAIYTAALRSVALETGVEFADVFTPTKALLTDTDVRFTLNGAHLNTNGYSEFGPILMKALFGNSPAEVDKAVKAEVADKNFHWWHRYRAVNGFSIYGDRGKAGQDGSRTYNNQDVMERERAILDQMCANRDQRIWQAAQGKTLAAKIDDSNTLPFLNPTTNVGGANDQNAKKGKLGSLDYLSAEDQLKKFKLAPGYEINLVASEEQFPELANPVCLNFDNKGRLWVSTMASYPHWKPKTKLDDKVLIFEDNDSDGKADVCRVFADGLHQPTGFEIGRGGAFIAQQPDILFVSDTDGDDKADTRIRKLVGFDSADSHHGLAAFTWGPGGNLYVNEGTFKFSQVESPYGLTRLHEGGIWKYDPATETFGVHVSMGFANPWGHVFDAWGQDFIGDASPGFSYWAAPISGRIDYPAKHPGGAQHRRLAKQTGGGPEYGNSKYKFPTLYKKRTRPSAGCEIVSSSNFPPEAQGNFLVTNVIGERCILNHKISEQGSGFVGQEVEPIVSCTDGNFRPVDCQFGPDGALYVVDWHNALIGHLQHNLRDPSRDHSHGRIWRIVCKDRPLVKPAKIAGEPIPALLDLLKSPEDRTRYRVRRELAERNGEKVAMAIVEWVEGLDSKDEKYEHQLLEALWVYQSHNMIPQAFLKDRLNSPDHRARAAAVRALSCVLDQADSPLALLKARVNDDHSLVRLEAVRALSFLKGDEVIEVALEVLEYDIDTYLQYTLDETMRVLEQ